MSTKLDKIDGTYKFKQKYDNVENKNDSLPFDICIIFAVDFWVFPHKYSLEPVLIYCPE